MRVIIIGLGNAVLADDSAGVLVARSLQQKIQRSDVTIVEATVAGLDVLNLITDYEKAIIIDAIQSGQGKAGTVYRLKPEQISSYHNASPHDIDFITALELGKKTGMSLPEDILIFAIEAGDVESVREECTPEVSAASPRCVEMICQELCS